MLGTWQVDSYKENGADQTTVFLAAFEDYLITFDVANNYIETYTLVCVISHNFWAHVLRVSPIPQLISV